MSRAEKAKGAKLSAPANTRAEDSATFTDDRISCYPPEVNGATADGEIAIEDGLGVYLKNLKDEKFALACEDPNGVYKVKDSFNGWLDFMKDMRESSLRRLEIFREKETLFKNVRMALRERGYVGLADEIIDLRGERRKALEEICEWSLVFGRCYIDLLSYVPADKMEDAPQYETMGHAGQKFGYFVKKYNALLDEEAQFVDTALANLRGWKSATGDDVREVKTAAESADANAAAAKTAAEGAKESAEGAEQVAKKTAAEVQGLKPEARIAKQAAEYAKANAPAMPVDESTDGIETGDGGGVSANVPATQWAHETGKVETGKEAAQWGISKYMDHLEAEAITLTERGELPPDGEGALRGASASMLNGDDTFVNTRTALRRSDMGRLADEITDRRARRREMLDEIGKFGLQEVTCEKPDGGKWFGTWADLHLAMLGGSARLGLFAEDCATFTPLKVLDTPEEIIRSTLAVLKLKIKKYNASVRDEYHFLRREVEQLTEWQTKTLEEMRSSVSQMAENFEASKTSLAETLRHVRSLDGSMQDQSDNFNEAVKDFKRKTQNADAEIKNAVESTVYGIEKKVQSMLNAHERKIGAFATDGTRKPTITERLKVVEMFQAYKKRTGTSSRKGFYNDCGNDPVMENPITGECRTLWDICPTLKHFSNLMHSAQEAKSKKKREAADEKPRKKVSKRQKRG